MKIRTIKAKITIWFSILFLILVASVMILLIFVAQSVVQNNKSDDLKELVLANLEELEYLNPDDNFGDDVGDQFIEWQDGFIEIDDDFCDYMNGIYISLYGGGELLYGENPIDAYPDILPPEDRKLQKIQYSAKEYYVYDIKVNGERLEGLWLRGIVNTQEDVPALLHVSRLMILVLPILAAIAIFGGYLLSKRAINPLDDISEQASQISGGPDLSKRIHIENKSIETDRVVDTFNGMFERLQNSFEVEKQFTSDVSHELRTPVAVILAECEYALEEESAAEWREALEVIFKQSKKMAEMIEELLTFTRIDRGTIDLRWEEVNLVELVREVCLEQELIWKKDICMNLELEEQVLIRADRMLLERLVKNLVANAYQYGNEPGNIWVRVYEENGKQILSVCDDGIGIQKEDIPNIWNRFYRGDNARKDRESTGLGLSMVRRIAILHHAETKVFSELGKGSAFLISF